MRGTRTFSRLRLYLGILQRHLSGFRATVEIFIFLGHFRFPHGTLIFHRNWPSRLLVPNPPACLLINAGLALTDRVIVERVYHARHVSNLEISVCEARSSPISQLH